MCRIVLTAAAWVLISSPVGAVGAATLRGKFVDSETSELLPARLYIRAADGKWHHVKSGDAVGVAVPYHVKRGLSEEAHTSLSAHAFTAELPPGRYTLTAARGKEWHAAVAEVELGEAGREVELKLRRWTDMGAKSELFWGAFCPFAAVG